MSSERIGLPIGSRTSRNLAVAVTVAGAGAFRSCSMATHLKHALELGMKNSSRKLDPASARHLRPGQSTLGLGLRRLLWRIKFPDYPGVSAPLLTAAIDR